MPPRPSTSFRPSAFAGLIGAARRDITPPPGMPSRMWGAATSHQTRGVHRPMTATALSFAGAAGDKPLILIAADLGWFKNPLDVGRLRGPVMRALDVDSSRLMLCLSHTHAGPSITTTEADLPGGEMIEPYLEQVAAALVDVARAAHRGAEEAVLTWAQGACALAQDRDYNDPVTGRPLVGFNPDGHPDQTLRVGRVTRSDGSVLATLVHYACHPTTLAWDNRMISPDYVGAMRELVESHSGDAPCLYLHGAAGELAPREQYTGETAIADRNGRQLGFAVLSALEGMLPPAVGLRFAGIQNSGAPLAVWHREALQPSRELKAIEVSVALPLKPQPKLEDLASRLSSTDDSAERERIRRAIQIARYVGHDETFDAPIWIWRLGDALLMGHPNEAYNALQMHMQEALPRLTVMIANVTNGSCGYLLPEACCQPDRYAFWQSPFERGALETLIERSREIACALIDD